MHNRLKITVIHDLLLNLPVLVWREGPIGQFSYWSSLYNLFSIENKTYTIQLPYRLINFHSMVIKLYLVDPKITKDTQLEDNKSKLFLS